MTNARPAAEPEGLKIAVTMPPIWFRAGNEKNQMVQQCAMLRGLGHSVHQVDMTPFVLGQQREVALEIERLTRFKPDVAFGTPNAGYALLPRLGGVDGGPPRNLFVDVLGIPTVLLWDDPGQIVDVLEGHLEPNAREMKTGVIDRIRAVLDHPLFVHGIYDAGHLALMRDIGMLTTARTVLVPSSAHPRFVALGRSGERIEKCRDVAFAGNLLLEARAEALRTFGGLFEDLERAVVGRKVRDAGASAWALMNEALEQVPREVLAREGMVSDNRFFWHVYTTLVGAGVNTLLRLFMLRALRHPVDVFGMFADNLSKHSLANISHLRYGGFLDVATEMPHMYASTRITIDWVNAIYIDAYTTKNVNCLAAGGFPLLSESADFIRNFGDLGRACLFRSPEEAADKLDYFLAKPGEREEIARSLQQKVLADFTMERIFSLLIAKAAESLA